MTLNLRLGRNSFHAAWLLLLVPPLTWSFQIDSNQFSLALLFFGVVPLIALLVPLSGIARRQNSSCALRLQKEFRAQLPGALLAIAGPGLLMLGPSADWKGFVPIPFFSGCALMGATAFGMEFEQRTMGSLLTQPFSRWTLYRDKLLVLGVLLGLALWQLGLGVWISGEFIPRTDAEGWDAMSAFLLPLIGPPIFAFCTGPLLSLRTRGTLAGTVFIAAVPMVLVLVGQVLLGQIWRWRHPGEALNDFAPHLVAWCWIVMPIYLVVSAWLGWKTFQSLEVRSERQSGSGSHPLAGILDRIMRAVWPHRGGSGTAMLVRKELRLHVVPWLVTTLMVGSGFLIWLAKPGPDAEPVPSTSFVALKDLTLFLAVIFGGMNLQFIGAACIAEERQLGTLDWQLTCPATVRRQWWVKVGVTLFLSVLLGLALPFLMIGTLYGESRWTDILPGEHWLVTVQALGGLCLAGVAVYGSSISRSTIKAACNAMVIQWGGALIIGGLGRVGAVWMDERGTELSEAWRANQLRPSLLQLDDSTFQTLIEAGSFLAPVAVLALFLWFAAGNFRRGIPIGYPLLWQLVKMSLGLAAITVAFLFALGFLFETKAINNWVRNPYIESRKPPQKLPRPAASNSSPPGGFDKSVLLIPPRTAARISAPVRMDPAMAKRYGLVPSTNPAAQMGSAAEKSGRTGGIRVGDPVMAKRYGLVVRPAASTNSPPPTP